MLDETPARVLYSLLEVAVVLGEHRAARALSERRACVARLSITEGDRYMCPARHLGDAAILLGNRTTANAYYVQALEAVGKIRFCPDLGFDASPAGRADGGQRERRGEVGCADPALAWRLPVSVGKRASDRPRSERRPIAALGARAWSGPT